jgi:LDH2 family malate/lactate/ureidoglycolate dehydrogenase
MPAGSEADIRIGSPTLAGFVTALLEAAGVAAPLAREWTASLIWANLRGVDSHGVLRVPRYVDLLKRKTINPSPSMKVERRAGAIVVLDADRAPGAIAMSRAMAEAIACARETRIGWCAARNITHAGAVGYFALQAAQAGMAGMVMTASGPLMAYHGARVSGVSTNPLAIAFPAGKRPPYLIDMSTSTVAMGKLMSARDARRDIPHGWGIDAQGLDTTDSAKVATLLPMAGAKGSGLSFMIECLCSLTVHNPIVASALEAGGTLDNPFLNGVALAVDLAAFGDVEAIRAQADRLGDAIAALPTAAGVDRIFLPGERGDTMLLEREQNGIPLAHGTWARLLATAKDLGIGAPETLK